MKRFFAILLAAVLLVSCFAGCEAAPGEAGAGETQPAVATTAAAEQAADIVINEVMPDNKKVCLGHEKDWVELYNRGETAVSLDGYYLTDDLQEPQAMPLTGMEIPAGGYLVVTLEEEGPFRLSADGETVYLLYGKQELSQLAFGLSEDGESFSQEGICDLPTPGFPNTEEGYQAYLESLVLPELTINEVLASNSKYMAVGGQYYDLLEVRNNSDQPLNLLGYTLTDKHSEPERYAFPDVTLEPGGFYVVYCSDNAALGEDHAPFKISASGETVYLVKNGAFVDALTIPGDMQKNESYGRVGNIPMYLEKPTLGEENAQGFATGVAAPAADIPSGIYEEPVTVTLSGEGTIYYTTDGSRPSEKSSVYAEPISISDVSTIRTFCVSGSRSSETVNYTYLVGKNHDLPVVTVSIPDKYLTGGSGLLKNYESKAEYEAVVTLIEDGEEKFSVPCGFRLHGNDSRKHSKKNFSLRFRSEYGVGKLEYKLFDDLDIEEFNSVLLKGGSEDWYKSMIRDELASAVAGSGTNLYTQATKPIVLYLGDEYWGIYYFRERYSVDYVASHLNVSPESVDIAYSNAAYSDAGDVTDFLDLRTYVQTHDMRQPEHYQYLTERIDVVSLMDWYICRSFMGDRDTANIRRFRSSEYDGKWRWMYFDVDWGFNWKGDHPFSSIATLGGDNVLMQAVLKNPEGRDAFLKRYDYLMDTILNGEFINGKIDELVNSFASEISADRARWKVSEEDWASQVAFVRDFVNTRKKRVLQDLQSYFQLSNDEIEYYFGD